MPLRINIPPLTRILLGVLLALSFLNFGIAYSQWVKRHRERPGADAMPLYVPYLTLVPQLSIFYPWAFATATFVEPNILALVLSAATILYGGRYLERAWGTTELARFLLIVVLTSNISASGASIGWYAVARATSTPYVTIGGGVALQSAFLVAFKQLVPEHTVAIAKGIIKIRVKHFPALFLAMHYIAALVLRTYTSTFLAWSGFLISWTYLRFYKFTPDYTSAATGRSSGTRGDASDTFAFASFVPEPLSSSVAVVSDRIYAVLLILRICTPFSAEDVEVGNEQAMARSEAALPTTSNGAGGRAPIRSGGKREEAERRRALALKALDQRLNAASSRAQQQPHAQHQQPAAAGPSRTSETDGAPGSQDVGTNGDGVNR